jgi:hypothetical protein
MLETILASMLGMAGERVLDAFGTSSTDNSKDNFSGALAEAMGASSPAPQSVVMSTANSMAGVLAAISASTDIQERNSLAMGYRQTVLNNLKDAGYDASAGADADEIILDGRRYDILASLNSPGAQVRPQMLALGTASSSTGSTAATITGTVDEVVFGTASRYQDLIDKANAATTMEERLDYLGQLRGKIVSALNAAGHSAYEIDSDDKIVINGNLFDIFFASKGDLTIDTRVQLLDHGNAAEMGITPPAGTTTSGTSLTGAIFAAGAAGSSLLQQISLSTDLEQRRSLGAQLTQLIVDSLNNQGYSAQTHSDPDKIVVNGTTYDVIRSLNSPGVTSHLQVLRMA